MFLRKEKKHNAVIVDADLVDKQTTQRYAECNKFIKTQLHLIGIVNPKFKETFRLYTEGYKQTEIGRTQGISKTTVNKRIKACVREIRQQESKK